MTRNSKLATSSFRIHPESPEAIRSLELSGVVLFEDIMSAETARELGELEARFSSRTSSYDPNQIYCHNLQWLGFEPLFTPLRNQIVTRFLARLFGDAVVCTGISFSAIGPGYRGMALHSDGKPHRSDIFGAAATCPAAVRVLVYPDGTDAARAPLILVPGSHLSLHADANPYRRYRDHADEVAVTCPPGGAVIIHHRLFHRAGANADTRRRRLFAYGLRPAWAGPMVIIAEPSPEELGRVPADVRTMFENPNRGSNPVEEVNHSDCFLAAGPGLSRCR